MVERLKACLNGGRTRDEHPAVPVTPAELRAAAQVAGPPHDVSSDSASPKAS